MMVMVLAILGLNQPVLCCIDPLHGLHKLPSMEEANNQLKAVLSRHSEVSEEDASRVVGHFVNLIQSKGGDGSSPSLEFYSNTAANDNGDSTQSVCLLPGETFQHPYVYITVAIQGNHIAVMAKSSE